MSKIISSFADLEKLADLYGATPSIEDQLIEEERRIEREAQELVSQQQLRAGGADPERQMRTNAAADVFDLLEVGSMKVAASYFQRPARQEDTRPEWERLLSTDRKPPNEEFRAMADAAESLIMKNGNVSLRYLLQNKKKDGTRGPRVAFISKYPDSTRLANLAWLNTAFRGIKAWAYDSMTLDEAVQVDGVILALCTLQREDEETFCITRYRNGRYVETCCTDIVQSRKGLEHQPADDREFLDEDDE